MLAIQCRPALSADIASIEDETTSMPLRWAAATTLVGAVQRIEERSMPQAVAFQATSQTLLQLMPQGQGLYVPVYQRNYTRAGGATQIDRLFEDVNTGLNRTSSSPGPPTFWAR